MHVKTKSNDEVYLHFHSASSLSKYLELLTIDHVGFKMISLWPVPVNINFSQATFGISSKLMKGRKTYNHDDSKIENEVQ